eukprot:m.230270 g.230270  ORF g.230270 m.230270 type:complete len:379 (+) comp54268_c0_seq4:100-1236(+)
MSDEEIDVTEMRRHESVPFFAPATTEQSEERRLPSPQETVRVDYRPQDRNPNQQQAFKVLTWNIERGYNLDRIIAALKAVDADVLLLQELDISCERTNFRDVFDEIARALQLNALFVCEFQEIHSPMREPRAQGGGVHGNAIMSKFDFITFSAFKHNVEPVQWNTQGEDYREPRRGTRVTAVATLATPFGPVDAYSVHLEVFCGIEARMEQFCEVLDLCRLSENPQIIGGDLNTMAHGIARFSSKYCNDWLRWGSLGRSEAQYWEDTLWSDPDLNPGFYDPFDVNTVTLSNYGGWFTGKLDHLRLRKLQHVEADVGGELADLGEGMGLSDHRWLSAIVCPRIADERTPLNPAADSLLSPAERIPAETTPDSAAGCLIS